MIDDIKQRDLNSGALWFTGPSSFTALAVRDRRTLLALVTLMEATMKVLPDGSRRTYEGMEAECARLEAENARWKAEYTRLMDDANKSSALVGDRCEVLEGIVRKGFAVVEDFMPNVGRCVLQDYARLNEFLIEARAEVNRMLT